MPRPAAKRIFVLINPRNEFRLNPFTGFMYVFTSKEEAVKYCTDDYKVQEYKLTKVLQPQEQEDVSNNLCVSSEVQDGRTWGPLNADF